MDDIHEEFLALSAALQRASDAELTAQLALMEAHLKTHFGQEDAWMAQTAFPPRDCHIQEHAAVLASVHEVRLLLAQGNVQVCRDLARALAERSPDRKSGSAGMPRPISYAVFCLKKKKGKKKKRWRSDMR
nr:hemerythrin domain-containing protein [Bordetella pseudohinzii]